MDRRNITDTEKISQIEEALSSLEAGEFGELNELKGVGLTFVYIVKTILFAPSKPTDADIEWALKTIEELPEYVDENNA